MSAARRRLCARRGEMMRQQLLHTGIVKSAIDYLHGMCLGCIAFRDQMLLPLAMTAFFGTTTMPSRM